MTYKIEKGENSQDNYVQDKHYEKQSLYYNNDNQRDN